MKGVRGGRARERGSSVKGIGRKVDGRREGISSEPQEGGGINGKKRQAKTTLGEPKTQDKKCPHKSQACGRGGLCGPRKQSRRLGPKKHPSYPIIIYIHRTGSMTGLLCT